MNKLLIAKTPSFQLIPQFLPQTFLSNFLSFPRKTQNFLNTPPRKCSYTPKIQTLCIITPSNSLNYGGWDDFQLNDDSVLSGESTQLQNFLNSLGINDKKYIFVYLLGFTCALGVTRIRVSSIIAIPACVIVFAVAFTLGYVNGGQLSLNGIKNRSKDEIFRGSYEKLRSLGDMLDVIYSNIVDLKNGIERNIENDEVTLADLEGIIKTAESVNVSALDAKMIVEGLLGSVIIENEDVKKNVNQKPSKKRKGVENGFNLSRYIAGLFQEKLVGGSNPSKNKDSDKKEANILAPTVKEQVLDSMLNREGGDRRKERVFRDMPNINIEGRRMNIGSAINDISIEEMDGFTEQDYQYKKKRFVYINSEEISMKMNHSNGDFRNDLLDSSENESSMMQERKFRDLKGGYLQFNNVEGGETRIEEDLFPSNQENGNELFDSAEAELPFRQERKFRNSKGNYLRFDNVEEGKTVIEEDQETEIVSEDKEFNSYLTKANTLLKAAKRDLLQKGNNVNAEEMLYKSAILLSKAVKIRPMSLLAVGQLGNTYLLHGELKLRISRKLRGLLAGKDEEFDSNDKLKNALVDVCEECEELLVKAGRNYRLALSIDGNDMRALYNWGLALSFRGQLIANIGPGAARDADKVFLAAIDKFDAMLSKSNACAPDALYRWGAALQQRSRLRRRNSKEKVKLLQQARRLYEDALDMESDNVQVKQALSSCISELNYWYN